MSSSLPTYVLHPRLLQSSDVILLVDVVDDQLASWARLSYCCGHVDTFRFSSVCLLLGYGCASRFEFRLSNTSALWYIHTLCCWQYVSLCQTSLWYFNLFCLLTQYCLARLAMCHSNSCDCYGFSVVNVCLMYTLQHHHGTLLFGSALQFGFFRRWPQNELKPDWQQLAVQPLGMKIW